jgi:hypothetical protein
MGNAYSDLGCCREERWKKKNTRTSIGVGQRDGAEMRKRREKNTRTSIGVGLGHGAETREGR